MSGVKLDAFRVLRAFLHVLVGVLVTSVVSCSYLVAVTLAGVTFNCL